MDDKNNNKHGQWYSNEDSLRWNADGFAAAIKRKFSILSSFLIDVQKHVCITYYLLVLE